MDSRPTLPLWIPAFAGMTIRAAFLHGEGKLAGALKAGDKGRCHVFGRRIESCVPAPHPLDSGLCRSGELAGDGSSIAPPWAIRESPLQRVWSLLCVRVASHLPFWIPAFAGMTGPAAGATLAGDEPQRYILRGGVGWWVRATSPPGFPLSPETPMALRRPHKGMKIGDAS